MSILQTSVALLATGIALSGPGCQLMKSETDVVRVEVPSSNSTEARVANQRGVAEVNRCEFILAEASFREAIQRDESYGPAHNNLGRVLFEQRKWKQAAESFHWAMTFMPDRPEPLNNLGMVYEAAANFDDAIEFYRQAHLLAADNPEYLANLVRARIRRGDRGEDLRLELQTLNFLEHRPEWICWIEQHLALFPEEQPDSTEFDSQFTGADEELESVDEVPIAPFPPLLELTPANDEILPTPLPINDPILVPQID